MKKLAIALGFALALPLSANAAVDLTGHVVVLNNPANSYVQSGKGLCYGLKKATLTQKTTIKATDLGFGDLGGTLRFTGPGAANETFTWDTDMLLDRKYGSLNVFPVQLTGIIVSRKGDDLVLSFSPADQLLMATALLAYSDAYPDLLNNASLDSLPNGADKAPVTPYLFKFDAKSDSMIETSYIQSYDGPCNVKSKITRKYKKA
jgi:hypothetical protein